MGLLEEVKAVIATEPNIWYDQLADLVDAHVISSRVYDTAPRWYDIWYTIIERHDEYVQLKHMEGSSGITQDIDRDYVAYGVHPVERQVTVYESDD